MAEQSTWIKLDRNILEWGWYKDANTKCLFIHLLLKANIKDAAFMGVTVHRGQLATSYANLSRETGMSIKSVRTALNHLKSTGEVASRAYHDFSLITIENYDRYQDKPASQTAGKGQATGKQGASKGQQSKNIRSKERKNIYTAPAQESRDWERDIPERFIGRFETEADWLHFWGTQE